MNRTNFLKYSTIGIIFLIGLSHILAFGYSNVLGITDGMYVKHIYTCNDYPGHSSSCAPIWQTGVDSTLSFSKTNDIIHVKWDWKDCDSNTWDVNSSNRIVSNNAHIGYWGPQDDSHNFEWIYTDVSLDDQINTYNHWRHADAIFNITGEAMLGSRGVWQLEDYYGSLLWYDKADGFLVNGTFRYSSDWEKFVFVEVGSNNAGAIPGYNFLFLIGVFFLTGCILIKNRKK